VPVGGRRNLLLRTEEFDNAVWTKTLVSVSPATAPDGSETAWVMRNASTGSNLKRITQSVTVTPGVPFRQTVIAKEGVFSTLGSRILSTEYVSYDLSVGNTSVGGTIYSDSTITAIGDGWYACSVTVTPTASPYVYWLGAGTGNTTFDPLDQDLLYFWRPQFELGSTATPYQRVTTQHDITEAGVPSIYKAFFDKADDILPITLPTITGGTVALVGTSGIWIEEDWGFTAGTLSIGPTTIAGLPAGILSVVGDLCAVIINDRAWTAAERAGVISWGKARGAPGVFSLGEELVTNGDFATNDLTGWTDNSTGTGSVAVADEAVELTGAGPANRGRIDQLISSFEVGSNYVLGVNSTVAINTQAVVTGVLSVNVTPPYSRFIFVPDITERAISFNVFGTGTNTLDNISVRKLELLP
jgi:hypothetical protein